MDEQEELRNDDYARVHRVLRSVGGGEPYASHVPWWAKILRAAIDEEIGRMNAQIRDVSASLMAMAEEDERASNGYYCTIPDFLRGRADGYEKAAAMLDRFVAGDSAQGAEP